MLHVGGMSPTLLLPEHHREIEAACRELAARAYADDPLELVRQYRGFEHEMLEHLEVEEQLLLPQYEEVAPDDTRAIREEHSELRRLLYMIAVEVELHVVRAATVDRLIARLRAHTARENAGLYPWADANLSLEMKRHLTDRMRHSMRELAQLRALRETAIDQPRL